MAAPAGEGHHRHTVGAVTIYEDNKGCRDLAQSSKFHARVKHIEIKHHYLRQEVQAGRVKLVAISSQEQVANIFTKALPRPAFERHASALVA